MISQRRQEKYPTAVGQNHQVTNGGLKDKAESAYKDIPASRDHQQNDFYFIATYLLR